MSRPDTHDIEQPALLGPPPAPVPDLCSMPGRGAYNEGLGSSVLLPQYKGMGILRGAPGASPTFRTYLADGYARRMNAEAEQEAEMRRRQEALW